MEFFNQAIDILKILVMALGAGLAVWGVINLLEGYGSDNPAAKSQGIKQLMAGGGVVLIGTSGSGKYRKSRIYKRNEKGLHHSDSSDVPNSFRPAHPCLPSLWL